LRITDILELGNVTNPALVAPAANAVTLQPGFSEGKVSRAVAVAAPTGEHFTFHELLSDLNPLQYLPVIGTIFRALTGDTVPEPLRDTGSLLVSGLVGGPIGLAMSLGALVVEKVTGIDPEKIGDEMLASVGIHGRTPVAVATVTTPLGTQTAQSATTHQTPAAWTPSQLAAYGVTATAGGNLKFGNLEGSDVLNSLEFARMTQPAVPQQTV
jgi:hypothetical protein